MVKEGILLGLGNPLLDITVESDKAFLAKYGLKANDAIIAEPKHMPIFEEISKAPFKPMYMAGGATQNTIRVAQWLLQSKNATTFIGGVGNDENGNILKAKAKEVGVKVRYQVHDKKSTGLCSAIITDENRSLVTNLGAATSFSVDFLEKPEIWEFVQKAEYYYIGGFVFPVCPEAIVKIAHHAAETNKCVVLNLSAPFLIKHFVDPKYNILEYTDVLFGNETEAACLAKQAGLKGQDLKDIALEVYNLPSKKPNRKRIIIFTQGRAPAIVCHDGKVYENQIATVDHSKIKDTNGAGDSFVGGFLSQLVQEKPLDICLKCANYAASVVVQHFGCNFPEKPDFK